MSERNQTLLAVVRVVGFMLAVVIGGLAIAAVLEGYVGEPDPAGMADDAALDRELPRPD